MLERRAEKRQRKKRKDGREGGREKRGRPHAYASSVWTSSSGHALSASALGSAPMCAEGAGMQVDPVATPAFAAPVCDFNAAE